MEVTEKIAYLKGLMEGLGIDGATKEGKMITAIVDLLDDIALSVSDLEDSMVILSDQMDTMDEDLESLQEDFYEDCGCGCEDDDEDLFDGELYEVTCPSCGDTICIDEDMLDEGEIDCPNCKETLEFDLSGALDECDCCGHDHDKE